MIEILFYDWDSLVALLLTRKFSHCWSWEDIVISIKAAWIHLGPKNHQSPPPKKLDTIRPLGLLFFFRPGCFLPPSPWVGVFPEKVFTRLQVVRDVFRLVKSFELLDLENRVAGTGRDGVNAESSVLERGFEVSIGSKVFCFSVEVWGCLVIVVKLGIFELKVFVMEHYNYNDALVCQQLGRATTRLRVGPLKLAGSVSVIKPKEQLTSATLNTPTNIDQQDLTKQFPQHTSWKSTSHNFPKIYMAVGRKMAPQKARLWQVKGKNEGKLWLWRLGFDKLLFVHVWAPFGSRSPVCCSRRTVWRSRLRTPTSWRSWPWRWNSMWSVCTIMPSRALAVVKRLSRYFCTSVWVWSHDRFEETGWLVVGLWSCMYGYFHSQSVSNLSFFKVFWFELVRWRIWKCDFCQVVSSKDPASERTFEGDVQKSGHFELSWAHAAYATALLCELAACESWMNGRWFCLVKETINDILGILYRWNVHL